MPARRSPRSRASPSRRPRISASRCTCRPSENADLLNRFLSQSSAIDCADVSIVFLNYLVGRNVLQAIPVAKVQGLGQDHPAVHQGHLSRRPRGLEAGRGALHRGLRRPDQTGRNSPPSPSEWLTGIPTVTNADTLGIRPDLVGPADHAAGPIWSAPSSRARRRCRTSRRSASSMSPWRWRRAATSSTATRAT